MLLFGATPQEHFPEAYVRVLRYRGTERGTGRRQQLADEVRVEGPVPLVLLQARDTIRERQPLRRALGPEGRFEDLGLIPEDAWPEGLVNAVVHRSYRLGGDHVRVEIESAGRFPGLVDPADPLLTLSAIPGHREVEAALPPGSREMLRVLRDAGRLGTGDVADAIGLSRPAAIKRLPALESAGLIEWVGHSPKGPRA